MYVIVPNYVRDAINKRLDEALGDLPVPAPDREIMYDTLLRAYNETGQIPSFDIKGPETPGAAMAEERGE